MDLITEEIENLVRQPIKSFKVTRGSKADDNHCSELFQITVDTKSEKTLTLIYKKFPTDPTLKDYSVRDQLFQRENYFYRSFAPNLDSLVKSHLDYQDNFNIMSGELINQLQFPIPKYYGGFNDDENDYVCMEDLRPKGFKMPDKTIGLNFLECSLVLQKLGQFHALSYFYLKYEGESVFQRVDNYSVFLKRYWPVPKETISDAGIAQEKMLEGFLRQIYKNSVDLIKNHCTAGDKEDLVFRMRGENDCVINSAYVNITSTTLNTDLRYFPLFIHGDLWLNNLLFSYDKNDEPIEVKFIDFQYARRGNIYEDLNYLFSTSTTVQFRKNHLEALLNIYYDAFNSALDLIDFPPPLNFTKEQFIEHYHENILPSYLMLSMLIPLQQGKVSEDGTKEDEYTDELMKRMERSPLALRRWEEVTREALELEII